MRQASGPGLLRAHHAQHVVAGRARGDGLLLDRLDHQADAAGADFAEPVRSIAVGLRVALFRSGRRRRKRGVLRKQLTGGLHEPLAVRVARLLQPGVDACHAADFRNGQVGRRVVARDHHLQQHVAEGRLQARVVIAKDARAAADVFLADRDALAEIDRALVGHLEREYQHRDLDYAGAVEDLSVTNTRGFIRGQVLDPDAGLPWKFRRSARDEVLQRRRRLSEQQT